MQLHTAADDVAFQLVEGGERRSVAVALLVVRHGAAALERQAGLRPVKRLDLALFVDQQDHRMRRWVDIWADDVAQLGGEVGIVGQLELLQPVRLQPVGARDALHRAHADADLRGGRPGRPMRRHGRRRPKRQRHELLGDRQRQRQGGNARQPRLIAQQTADVGLHEPRLPAPSSGLGHARQPNDGRRAMSGGGQQHHAGAPNVLLRAVTVGEHCEQPLTISKPDVDGDPSTHASDSHIASRRGNAKRVPPPDFIH